jgi:hypothetical protein
MTAQKTLGFIAINRSIFDHPALKKPERFRAWQWLIAQAAFKPEGRRGSWGVVHLERGELPVTVRILAEKWGWPKSNVDRFLKRLERDGMIARRKTGTPTGTPTGTHLAHEVQIVTICNYEKFQAASTGPKVKAGQEPGQQPGHQGDETPTLPGLLPDLTIKPLNNIKTEKGGDNVVTRERSAPKHGAQSGKHRTVYLYAGTEEWRIHAQDFREATGAEPLPDRWGGFWFYSFGERLRPPQQRTWRRYR